MSYWQHFILLFSILSALLFTESNASYQTNLERIVNLKSVSKQCLDQMQNLDPLTLLKMFDASTKIPNGILDGTMYDLGVFDECYDIEVEAKTLGIVYGKYCIGTMPFTSPAPNGTNQGHLLAPRMLGMEQSTLGFHFSLCVPHGCTAQDISGLSIFTEDFCYSKATAPEFDAGAIAATAVIGVFLAIAVISTIYDIYLYYKEKKCVHELLIAFSFLSNGRKLFKITNNPDQLLSLNGIKAISMMWVVFGHTHSNLMMFAPMKSLVQFSKYQESFWNMYLMGATISVDSFFFVGGLVTVYVFLKAHEKGVKLNIPLYYLHRYLRLTPAFAIVILFSACLLKYFGNGPLWSNSIVYLEDSCKKYWWANLFYFQNYVDVMSICVPQSWYLSVDMQYFLLSPLVLIPLSKWGKKALYEMYALVITGVLVPFLTSYFIELSANQVASDTQKYMKYYYDQAYARFAPYVIGMICGYYVYQYRKPENKIKFSPLLSLGLWFIALSVLLACLFAGYDVMTGDYNRISHSFYLGFNRPSWAIGLAMVVFLCETGHGGPIYSFLKLPVFQLITKLSYSMYLVHFIVITVRYTTSRVLIPFTNIESMFNFWGIFMFTFLISLLLSLMFESPIIVLEKHLLGRGRKQSNEVKKPQV